MAKEIKVHNLTNFPKLKELPGITWEKGKGEEKDKDGNVVPYEFKYLVFKNEHYQSVLNIIGLSNLVAILNDESKRVFRSAPSEEKLQTDAVNALIRVGFSKEKALEMLSSK